ncbi:hypothetical protein BpHYR1_039451 [Brachionus plicatilis]|uniref:FAM86 N-terminal domain-containing protein n=1 Tax=Brachionus plicatilis TaxID=10195 RepID=A0A3M7PAL5_BRAPC|nr:hypothetical protein BpHYR1_039451 [Brachionus plicatilis]
MLDNLNGDKRNLLIDIKCLYGLNHDSSKLLVDFFESDDVDCLQKFLIQSILKDFYLTKYQPSSKYRKSFLKKVISILESKNHEIDSEIYDSYISIINKQKSEINFDEEKYFVCCFLKEDMTKKPVIFEQFLSAITCGTTGLHIWPACYELINFIEKNKNFLDNKNILELGSGVGFLGLKCLNWGFIKHFFFTDCHGKVLKQIERNLLLNYDEKEINGLDCSIQDEDKLISIFELNWLDFDQNKNHINKNLDVILATDVIFDPDLIEPFVRTLNFIWSCQTNPQNLRAVIASTIRNESTYKIFIDQQETTEI